MIPHLSIDFFSLLLSYLLTYLELSSLKKMVIIAENETMKCSFMIKGEEMAGTGFCVGDISFTWSGKLWVGNLKDASSISIKIRLLSSNHPQKLNEDKLGQNQGSNQFHTSFLQTDKQQKHFFIHIKTMSQVPESFESTI